LTATTALLAILLQQPRDVRAPSRGAAIISGVVVSDDVEARPVRHARVMCSAPNVPGQTAITDDRGRFVFAGLPAGRYLVGATKTAWITAWYGARRPARPGSPLPIEDGQTIDIVLRMPRGAVVSGTVTDFTGEPAANAGVEAMRYATINGERRLVPAGSSATTDDRGAYRIYGLAPGDYVVQAAGRGIVQELHLTTDLDLRYARSTQARTPPPPVRTVKFAATYFPAAVNSTQASLVTVRAGDEREGIDIQMQLEPAVRIEGIVVSSDGSVLPGAEVSLISTPSSSVPGTLVGAPERRHAGSDGTFAIANVGPGTYSLIARAARPITLPDGTPGPMRFLWASADVAVEGEPITGLVLSLQPGMAMSGEVRFVRTTLTPPSDMKAVRVTLQPVLAPGLVGFAPSAVSPDPDGRFTLAGVTPGRYRLSATFAGSVSAPGIDRTGGWMLRSATIGGQDTLDVPVAIQPGQNVTGAAITFVDRPTRLSGSVRDASGNAAQGMTVVIFPTDQALWTPQSRRIQGVRPSADGAYAINGLPPGDYMLATIEDIEPGEWFDPAVLQRLAPSGMRIAMAEGEQKVQDIRTGRGGLP
jgi:uncharacterized protein (DUF2141 family)